MVVSVHTSIPVVSVNHPYFVAPNATFPAYSKLLNGKWDRVGVGW
jgi:hypothetical protein